MKLPSYFILNEHEKKRRILSSTKNRLNGEYYDNLLKKLKKENEEATNVSTIIKTKNVKQKFSGAKKISFNKNENNEKNVHFIIDKVFDKNKENFYKNEKVKLFLISEKETEIKKNEKKQRNIKVLNQHFNVYNIDTNKNVDENKKNVSNKVLKCLLCCCPMN